MTETRPLIGVGFACSLLVGLWAVDGCLLDDNKCDEHQVMEANPQLACACAPGYALSAKGYGCEPCTIVSSHRATPADLLGTCPDFRRIVDFHSSTKARSDCHVVAVPYTQ